LNSNRVLFVGVVKYETIEWFQIKWFRMIEFFIILSQKNKKKNQITV